MDEKKECCNCGWVGIDDDCKKSDGNFSGLCVEDLACPKCECNEFYDLEDGI